MLSFTLLCSRWRGPGLDFSYIAKLRYKKKPASSTSYITNLSWPKLLTVTVILINQRLYRDINVYLYKYPRSRSITETLWRVEARQIYTTGNARPVQSLYPYNGLSIFTLPAISISYTGDIIPHAQMYFRRKHWRVSKKPIISCRRANMLLLFTVCNQTMSCSAPRSKVLGKAPSKFWNVAKTRLATCHV